MPGLCKRQKSSSNHITFFSLCYFYLKHKYRIHVLMKNVYTSWQLKGLLQQIQTCTCDDKTILKAAIIYDEDLLNDRSSIQLKLRFLYVGGINGKPVIFQSSRQPCNRFSIAQVYSPISKYFCNFL